jgi:ferredoxin
VLSRDPSWTFNDDIPSPTRWSLTAARVFASGRLARRKWNLRIFRAGPEKPFRSDPYLLGKRMFGKVTTTIDHDLCTGCGLCVQVCPSGTLSMHKGKAEVTGDRSLNCGHCQAICPEGAVIVGAIDGAMSRFVNFQPDQSWLPYGDFDTAQLVRLMASRRSCRTFLNKPVDRSILEDLVKIGCTAPSGTNCQLWTFTILSTRKGVMALG